MLACLVEKSCAAGNVVANSRWTRWTANVRFGVRVLRGICGDSGGGADGATVARTREILVEWIGDARCPWLRGCGQLSQPPRWGSYELRNAALGHASWILFYLFAG